MTEGRREAWVPRLGQLVVFTTKWYGPTKWSAGVVLSKSYEANKLFCDVLAGDRVIERVMTEFLEEAE